MEDEISQDVFDKSQVCTNQTTIVNACFDVLLGIRPRQSKVRLLLRSLLTNPKRPVHPIRRLTQAVVLDGSLAISLPARPLPRGNLSLGVILLHFQPHLAGIGPATELLQHVRVGGEFWV